MAQEYDQSVQTLDVEDDQAGTDYGQPNRSYTGRAISLGLIVVGVGILLYGIGQLYPLIDAGMNGVLTSGQVTGSQIVGALLPGLGVLIIGVGLVLIGSKLRNT